MGYRKIEVVSCHMVLVEHKMEEMDKKVVS